MPPVADDSTCATRDCDTNGLQEFFLAGGLVQESRGAGAHRPVLFFLARLGTDEHNRNLKIQLSEAALQLQAAHPRHAHIEQQAGSLSQTFRLKKFFRRRESLGRQAGTPQESSRGVPDRSVIVHNGHEKLGGLARGIRIHASKLMRRRGRLYYTFV